MKPYLLREVDRINRNLLSISLTAFAVLIVSGYLAWSGFVLLFTSPRTVTHDQIRSGRPGSVIGVRADRVIDTAYFDRGKRLVALTVGDTLLLTRVDREAKVGVEYDGILEPMSSRLREDVVTSIEAQFPDVEGRFLPHVLDTTGYRGRIIAAGMAWLVLGVTSLFGIWLAASGLHDNFSDAAMKSLARYGTLPAVVEAVEKSMAGKTFQLDRALVLDQWLVLPGLLSLQVMRLDDVVWFYHEPPQWEVRGWFAVADHSLIVYDRHGVRLNFRATKEVVDRLVLELQSRVSWAASGYTRNMEMLWRVDRHAFLEEVDDRRRREHSLVG